MKQGDAYHATAEQISMGVRQSLVSTDTADALLVHITAATTQLGDEKAATLARKLFQLDQSRALQLEASMLAQIKDVNGAFQSDTSIRHCYSEWRVAVASDESPEIQLDTPQYFPNVVMGPEVLGFFALAGPLGAEALTEHERDSLRLERPAEFVIDQMRRHRAMEGPVAEAARERIGWMVEHLTGFTVPWGSISLDTVTLADDLLASMLQQLPERNGVKEAISGMELGNAVQTMQVVNGWVAAAEVASNVEVGLAGGLEGIVHRAAFRAMRAEQCFPEPPPGQRVRSEEDKIRQMVIH